MSEPERSSEEIRKLPTSQLITEIAGAAVASMFFEVTETQMKRFGILLPKEFYDAKNEGLAVMDKDIAPLLAELNERVPARP